MHTHMHALTSLCIYLPSTQRHKWNDNDIHLFICFYIICRLSTLKWHAIRMCMENKMLLFSVFRAHCRWYRSLLVAKALLLLTSQLYRHATFPENLIHILNSKLNDKKLYKWKKTYSHILLRITCISLSAVLHAFIFMYTTSTHARTFACSSRQFWWHRIWLRQLKRNVHKKRSRRSVYGACSQDVFRCGDMCCFVANEFLREHWCTAISIEQEIHWMRSICIRKLCLC